MSVGDPSGGSGTVVGASEVCPLTKWIPWRKNISRTDSGRRNRFRSARGTTSVTRVCLVGSEDCDLRYELLSRETARDALATYDLDRPFANSVAVETVSLGAAVALLNDLDWYLARFAETALVRDPSISDGEWLSRTLATAVREGRVDPAGTDRYLKVYGVVRAAHAGGGSGDCEAESEDPPATEDAPRLVEPMYVARTGRQLPEYDLRDVEETLVVRVTESEFGG